MRIAYAGTPEFAVPALDAVARAGHHVVAVYTQPDRAAGRGRALTASPVKRRALELGLPVLQPASVTEPHAAAELAAFRPDVMVVAAYGLLLPRAMLSAPRHGCINIHASLLPRWRGAAPIQRAIQAGDAETGVCIMRMEAGLDTGPVYARVATPIGPTDTASVLTDRLALLGADLLVASLERITNGELAAKPQPESGRTYARKVLKAEATIDWTLPALQIERQVRAFDPWPVAETTLAGDLLRVWAATALDDEVMAASGSVVRTSPGGIDVATGAGVLRLTRIQAAGRKPVSAADFLNSTAGRLCAGAVLGS